MQNGHFLLLVAAAEYVASLLGEDLQQCLGFQESPARPIVQHVLPPPWQGPG